ESSVHHFVGAKHALRRFAHLLALELPARQTVLFGEPEVTLTWIGARVPEPWKEPQRKNGRCQEESRCANSLCLRGIEIVCIGRRRAHTGCGVQRRWGESRFSKT